jgi:uncharacterized cupin superfamily protein
MCAGFKVGTGNAHRLINETSEEVVYLEVGDRSRVTKAVIRMMISRRCWKMADGISPTKMERLTAKVNGKR